MKFLVRRIRLKCKHKFFVAKNSKAKYQIEGFRVFGILVELTGFRRNRVYAFQSYIDLFALS